MEKAKELMIKALPEFNEKAGRTIRREITEDLGSKMKTEISQ